MAEAQQVRDGVSRFGGVNAAVNPQGSAGAFSGPLSIKKLIQTFTIRTGCVIPHDLAVAVCMCVSAACNGHLILENGKCIADAGLYTKDDTETSLHSVDPLAISQSAESAIVMNPQSIMETPKSQRASFLAQSHPAQAMQAIPRLERTHSFAQTTAVNRTAKSRREKLMGRPPLNDKRMSVDLTNAGISGLFPDSQHHGDTAELNLRSRKAHARRMSTVVGVGQKSPIIRRRRKDSVAGVNLIATLPITDRHDADLQSKRKRKTKACVTSDDFKTLFSQFTGLKCTSLDISTKTELSDLIKSMVIEVKEEAIIPAPVEATLSDAVKDEKGGSMGDKEEKGKKLELMIANGSHNEVAITIEKDTGVGVGPGSSVQGHIRSHSARSGHERQETKHQKTWSSGAVVNGRLQNPANQKAGKEEAANQKAGKEETANQKRRRGSIPFKKDHKHLHLSRHQRSISMAQVRSNFGVTLFGAGASQTVRGEESIKDVISPSKETIEKSEENTSIKTTPKIEKGTITLYKESKKPECVFSDVVIISGVCNANTQVKIAVENLLANDTIEFDPFSVSNTQQSEQKHTYKLPSDFTVIFLCSGVNELMGIPTSIRDNTMMFCQPSAPSQISDNFGYFGQSVILESDWTRIRSMLFESDSWLVYGDKGDFEHHDGVTINEDVFVFILNMIVNLRNLSTVGDLSVTLKATLAMKRGTRAHAAVNGRRYVVPDDVLALTESILCHRMSVIPAKARDWLANVEGSASMSASGSDYGEFFETAPLALEDIHTESQEEDKNGLTDSEKIEQFDLTKRVVNQVVSWMHPPI